MKLSVNIKKSLPRFDLDVSFSCVEGSLSVLIGPSGAGKTTIIRMIAGLQRPSKGLIQLNGETWVDTDKKVFIPPQKRQVGFVFQDYTLFPHLNIYDNVSFAAVSKDNIQRLLELFNIWSLRHSKPDQISGGERQRAAICQNLARKPRLLLLDEPFSALDIATRRKLRQELKSLNKEFSLTMIHVTHDLTEALFLGDNIFPIVMGKITPEWLPQQIAEAKEEDVRRLQNIRF